MASGFQEEEKAEKLLSLFNSLSQSDKYKILGVLNQMTGEPEQPGGTMQIDL